MAIVTINIDNEKDLSLIKELLNRFDLQYKIDKQTSPEGEEEKLSRKFKQSFGEIKEWEAGRVDLQSAKDAIAEIKTELSDDI